MHDQPKPTPKELETLRMAFALLPQPIFVLDAADQRIVDANPAGCEVLNLARGKLVGSSWCGFVERLGSPQSHPIEIQGRHYIAAIYQPALDEIQRDVASRDVLTGLPNRQALFAKFAAAASDPSLGGLSLMFIDVDGFKRVNDTWGHVFGDRVLQIVAQRLSGSIRKCDLVVRFGGDEFIVAVEGACKRGDLERRAKQIARALQTPISVDGRELTLSASIGIARPGARLSTAEALIAKADRAMYRAKAINRDGTAAKRATGRLAIVNQPGRRRRLA
jgi:diguanylate cyclase (GGDEF)-like protein